MNCIRCVSRDLAGLRGSGEPCERAHECLGRAVVCAQPQDGPKTRLDQPPGAVNQPLHNRLDPTSLGFVAHRRVGAEQATLAHQARDVHGHRRKLAQAVVRIELARGQPCEIKVGLGLGMELLMRAGDRVQTDHVLSTQVCRQARYPAVRG